LQRLRDDYPFVANQRIRNSCAVLSRYPIRETVGFLPAEPGFPYTPRAVIDVDGRDIVVYCVSLPAPLRDRARIPLQDIHNNRLNSLWDLVFGYDETRRDVELTTLVARMQNESLPLIAAGDFNLSDQDSSYRDLAARWSDGFRSSGFGMGTTYPVAQFYGFPSVIPALVRIDYVWHSDHLRAVTARNGDFVGSDHLPLLVELSLR
jgi:endonuclease/exonuclease/phosphatase family metal-dependent hydrolase